MAKAHALLPDPNADAVRAAGLRRMRVFATGLLVVAAIVYLATLNRDGVWGFVNAGAEASMVGAIADWFAVTALFRHPLGLPIPHTALIPRRKDELGKGLEDFVGDNFMAPEVIRERLAAAALPQRVGSWLREEKNARRAVDELSVVLRTALAKVPDADIAELVNKALIPRFRDEPLSPVLGTLLAEVVRDDLHHNAVDLVLEELERWLTQHEEIFSDVVSERAPSWLPSKVNDVVVGRLHTEALKWVGDIRRDPTHRARAAVDSMLAQLADDLLNDPATQARCERFKVRVLEHPQIGATAVSLWQALRNALVASLEDPESAVRTRAVDELVEFGTNLLVDTQLAARMEDRIVRGAIFLVERYGTEAAGVITHTIQQWDGKEAADRIELYVGKDLQYIRINGTLVGGLVGVLIHTVSLLLT